MKLKYLIRILTVAVILFIMQNVIFMYNSNAAIESKETASGSKRTNKYYSK